MDRQMKYVVYEDGKLAKYPDYINVDPILTNCEFLTFEEARQYAKRWMGKWDTTPDDWNGNRFVMGAGYATTEDDIGVIEIRMEKSE
jgi:hypothetical protein